jgi:hypothetical protein
LITEAEKLRIKAMSDFNREVLAGYLEGVLGPAWEEIPVNHSHAKALLDFINSLKRQN